MHKKSLYMLQGSSNQCRVRDGIVKYSVVGHLFMVVPPTIAADVPDK